ncbi:NUDIX domain-containing protein [Kribbella sandramycini]|uniref:8-oxo-dGTP diphosphatase n=1 Tax=Kribbella sandramycini TaxID=60450 RepID=A0A7Y4P2B4_9ACTN|nr:NUDIX domain-containing protein [Kribbella sandramycini]MBB6566391.1 8-oxo-dGTP diphosphatase [Kribbella sandramycini]NOL42949.1 NUDIX domain-containing protein [Kribbella sandramycini]
MSHPATVIAAGGVVWRERRGAREVLLVHRPRYDDWSLPKGKLTPHEHVLLGAHREIEEETGEQVLIGPSLGVQRYPVRKNGATVEKLVHYWSAVPTTEHGFEPNDEVDEIAWLPVGKARGRLSYPRDVGILDALGGVVSVVATLIVVRHAEAVKRKEWDGKDTLRPLNDAGTAVAARLTGVLAALGANRLISSDAERCVATLTPYADSLQRHIHLWPEISERGYDADPGGLDGLAERAWKPGKVTVVCSHRPVLPALARELGLKVGKFATGSFVVAHRLADGRMVSERFRAP